MKKISYLFLTFLLLTLTAESNAQAPKWLDKARQSVFSVVTFDAEGNVKGNGNAFFVSEDGVALSDYNLFRGA